MYNRIILKLSGETLAPSDYTPGKDKSAVFDPKRIDAAAGIVARLSDMGVQVGIVLGGGNIWRGRFTDTMDPVAADQMGMLATIINALAFQEALQRAGKEAVVYTSQEMDRFCEHYRADKAVRDLEAGRIVLLAGGSGNPFFTTDTAAALRAAELKADAVFKGTTVDGLYDADPDKVPTAKLIPDISYQEAIARGLRVMDLTAFQLCMERHIPAIRIFSMADLENILRVAEGDPRGTVVHP